MVAGVQREGSTAPGAASAARAGVRLSVAGRSAVLRRRRFGPALLREAPRCSCLAVACGDRGVSDSTWAGGLLFGTDGVAATVSRDRVRPGMPPRPPRLPQAPRQSRLRCGTPSLSPRAPRPFRRSREAAACRVWMSTPPAIGRLAHPVRFAPAARRSSGVAHPCPRGCICPTQLRHTRVSRHCALAPRRRHPRAMAPRLHRISTGRLVSQSVGMAPDHAATGRLPHGCYDSASTKAAPAKVCYHPCRDCAPGRFSAPSLPDSLHRATCRGRRYRPLPAARAVVTVRCASNRARPTNTTTARIIVSLARVTSM